MPISASWAKLVQGFGQHGNYGGLVADRVSGSGKCGLVEVVFNRQPRVFPFTVRKQSLCCSVIDQSQSANANSSSMFRSEAMRRMRSIR